MCNDCQISLLYSPSNLIYTLDKSINIGAQSWKKVPWLLQMIMFEDSYCVWTGQCSRYSYWLWAGRSEDQIPVGARFSAPVQTSPGAHPASCTMGTGSFPGVKNGRGMTLTPHPFQWRDEERVELYYSTGRMTCTEPQFLQKGEIYFFLLLFCSYCCMHLQLFCQISTNTQCRKPVNITIYL